MSLKITAKLLCDNCRAEIVGKTCDRSTRSGESYWDAKRVADKNGWLTVSRGRYRKPAHYCNDCADKPVAKIQDPPRPKKCQECKDAAKANKADKHPRRMNMGYRRCPTCGWKRTIWEYV